MKQKSLSTSSFDWAGFVKTLLCTATGALCLLYLSIYLIDPYDVFMFSPEAQRSPVSSKRRHFNPGIARRGEFDSFIMGTSTAMLLKPQRLNQLLSANIANLTLPDGSPYEQLRIAALFEHFHKDINLVIVSIDKVWCQSLGAGNYIDMGNDQVMEERQIQEWLYSTNFWTQLPPLNSRIVKHMRRQFTTIFGFTSYRYGRDGYTDFTRRFARKYDKARIQKYLYGSSLTQDKTKPKPSVSINSSEIEALPFPDLNILKDWLASLPKSTRKILFFPPYHFNHIELRGAKKEALWKECKKRIASISQVVPQVTVVDFMIKSSITLNDSNYWDSRHYTVAIADKIENTLADILMIPLTNEQGDDKATTEEYFQVLGHPNHLK